MIVSFFKAFGKANDVLLASLLHYKTHSVGDIEQFLKEKGVRIR